MKNIVMKSLVFTLIAVGYAATLHAQVPAAPRELGMGGAFVGVARGYESIFLTPANLVASDAPRWSFGFPQVGSSAALLGPSFGDVPDLIDFDGVTAERQEELLDLIPLDGTEAQINFRAPLAAFSVGSFGLGVQYVATGSHSLSRDLAELFLKGYEDGRTDYSIGDTFGQRATYWDVAASYAHRVGTVGVGATGHYIRGGTLVRTRLFEPVVDLEAQEISVDYIGVRAPGGNGYALDLGAFYEATPDLTIAASITNAFARMNWTEDLRVRSFTLDRDAIDNASPQDLLNQYEASERDLDPAAVSLQVYDTAEGLYEEAYFPTVARFGVGWKPLPSTRVGVDFHRKVTEGRLGDEWDQRFAIGVEQGLSIFSLRAGYGAGNDGGNLLGGGLSIGPLDIGVARYQRSDIDGDKTRGWIGTFGLGVDQPM